MKVSVLFIVLFLLPRSLYGSILMVPLPGEEEQLSYDLDPLLKSTDVNQLLICFAKKGCNREVAGCLDAGANVNAKNEKKRTALMMAAKYGHKSMVRLLLGKGAEVDAIDEAGMTALMLAAQCGHSHIVQMLYVAGANINTVSNTGWSALMFAINGREPHTVAALLAYKTVDINLQAHDQQTAMSMAESAPASAYTREIVAMLRVHREERRRARRWCWPFIFYAE